MKTMFNRIKYWGLLSCILLTGGCDEIENPTVTFGTYDNEKYGPPPDFSPLTAPVQKVLLEDFTGHDCGNCPAAHLIANQIAEEDEEHIALVAVHAGSLAMPFGSSFPDDWRTDEGEYYLLTQIGVDLLPVGRVNRTGGASQTVQPNAWPAAVENALGSTASVDMQIQAEYIEDDQVMNLHVSTEWFQNESGNFKLVILLTEDSIVAPQLNYDSNPEYIPNYLHRHMLRGSVSGATGLTVANNPTTGSSSVNSFTFPWNAEWMAEHTEIIAFVTRGDNGEVLNVSKKKLVE